MRLRNYLILIFLLISAAAWAVQVPKELAEGPVETIVPGNPKTLATYRGQVVVLFLMGQNCTEAAFKQAGALANSLKGEKVHYIMVADLVSVPTPIKDKLKELMIDALKKTNGMLPKEFEGIQLWLDWDGLFSRILDVRGETVNAYYLLVISKDKDQRILLDLHQKVNDITEEQIRAQAEEAVRKAL
jgi:hypothetical protein